MKPVESAAKYRECCYMQISLHSNQHVRSKTGLSGFHLELSTSCQTSWRIKNLKLKVDLFTIRSTFGRLNRILETTFYNFKIRNKVIFGVFCHVLHYVFPNFFVLFPVFRTASTTFLNSPEFPTATWRQRRVELRNSHHVYVNFIS